MTAPERQTGGEFRRLGDIVDLSARFAELEKVRDQRRAERFATYQWPEGTRCAECGDTLYPPDTPGKTCLTCPAGRAEQEQLDRIARWKTIVKPRFADYTLASHPNQAMARQVRDWLERDAPSGHNLILLGLTARGKTGLAIGALRELYASGKQVRFATVPDILNALRPRDDNDQKPAMSVYHLQAVAALLMDDLGAEKPSDWVTQTIYAIVNGRYERGLPTIVTSNLSMKEIEASGVGARTVSRLQEDATILEVSGPDLRIR